MIIQLVNVQITHERSFVIHRLVIMFTADSSLSAENIQNLLNIQTLALQATLENQN